MMTTDIIETWGNPMNRYAATLIAVAATATLLVPTAANASAASGGRYFSSCDALTSAWPNGVAKGPVAATKAVRDGYSRPATTAKARGVYATNNSRLDRDKDGTACEN